PRLDGLHITNGGATSPDATSTVRMPSDGAFTNLYNQMVESNGSTSHMAAPRIPSDTSFTDVYDQIATEIREQLHDVGNGVKSPAMNSSIQSTPVEKQRPFAASNDQRRSRLILEQIQDRHLQFGKPIGLEEEIDEDEPEAPRPILQIHRADSVD